MRRLGIEMARQLGNRSDRREQLHDTQGPLFPGCFLGNTYSKTSSASRPEIGIDETSWHRLN